MGKKQHVSFKCNQCSLDRIHLTRSDTCGNVSVQIGQNKKVFAPRTAPSDIVMWLNSENIGEPMCHQGLAATISRKLAEFL